MTDHETACSTTVVAAPWRMAASHHEGTVLDPATVMPFGQALDTLLECALQYVVDSGHRIIGKPRLVVRTRETAATDERLQPLGGAGIFPPVLGAHTWLVLTVERTCAPMEAPC